MERSEIRIECAALRARLGLESQGLQDHYLIKQKGRISRSAAQANRHPETG